MADKREKRVNHTTPFKGVFKFPKLNEADTKFKDAGEYSLKLVVDPEVPGVKELIKACDKHAAASLAAAKAEAKGAKAKKWATKYLPYGQEEDDQGDETGNIEFKFSMTASGKSKKTGKVWERRPGIFDASGKIMADAPPIWGGTIGKVSFQFFEYAPTTQIGASVKLALEAVQIIDLVSSGSRDAASYGFDEEDGYEYEGSDEAPAADEDDDDQDDSEDGKDGDEEMF